MRSLPDAKIRIMILNPSGGAGFNDLVAETVMKYKDPNTHVTVASLADRIGGTQTLAYPVLRPLVYGEMIRACLQCRKENYDALIVNCFVDPMVDELRQIAGDDMVVLGARQMAVQTVSRLGCRYAVLSLYDMQGSQDPLLQRCLSDTRTAVSHPLIDVAFNDDLTPMNVEGLRESLATQGELAVRQDGAETLILGCTAMSGCWRGLMRAVGVPVIDPTVAALRGAGEAVRLKREFGWGASTKGAGNVPTENQLELIAEQSYPYSGRIEIE